MSFAIPSKVHSFYYEKINLLKKRVHKLKKLLPEKDFREHKDVKFAARLRKATLEIVLENPDRLEYKLKGELKKYRRYKKGLQRYRLFFSFHKHPPIILYLYINDKKSLRNDGEKNDSYKIFSSYVKRGIFSHDHADPRIQKWIQQFSYFLETEKV